jgi:hypothetical protein
VDARVAAPALDVALERGLLVVVEDVARGRQPDHDVVLPEVRVGEGRAVLGRVDGEAVLGAQPLDRGDAGPDRAVAEACGLAEDEGLERVGLPVTLVGLRRDRAQRCAQGDRHERGDEERERVTRSCS